MRRIVNIALAGAMLVGAVATACAEDVLKVAVPQRGSWDTGIADLEWYIARHPGDRFLLEDARAAGLPPVEEHPHEPHVVRSSRVEAAAAHEKFRLLRHLL